MFSLRTLGALELRSTSGEDLSAVLGGQKLVALLAFLAVAKPRGLHRRDTIVALLWPDLDQDRARAALRHTVYRLRRSLGADAIINRGDEDIGIDRKIVQCDAATFEDLLDAESAAEALELYRGDLLPGFFVPGATEFERWLDGERVRLRGRASSSAWGHATACAGSGRWEDAVRWGKRATALAPDDEQLLRRVLTLLAERGDIAGALREYETFARRLQTEYEATPSAETTALVDRLKRRGLAPVNGGRSFTPQDRQHTQDEARLTRASSDERAVEPMAVPSDVQPSESNARTAPVPDPRVRTRRIVTRAALGTVVLAGVVLGSLAVRDRVATKPVAPTIAVLPFDVRGSRELDYLGEGMSDLLSIGLDGVAGLRSADPRLVLTVARREGREIDARAARRVAERVGAGLYVTGSVVEASGRIALTGALHDRTGRVRAVAQTRTAEVARLFDLVDELSRQLMAGEVPEPNDLVRLAARTSTSVAALRAFLDGERAIRSGRHAAALEAFQQAVTEDSTFALAYYRLGAAGRWMTEYALASAAAGKAALYGSALPSYARRLLTAQQAIHRGAYAEAESLYRAGIASRPGDVDAWFGLGDLFYHYNPLRGRSKGEGADAFEHALAIDPEDGQSRLHLLELRVWEGNARQVDSLLPGLDEGSDFALKWPFVQALIVGDTVVERRTAEEFRQLNDRGLVRVVIHSASAFPSNLVAATRVLDLLTEPTRSNGWRAYGHHLRAQVELARGRWTAARADLVAMGALEPAAATEYGAVLSVAPFLPVDRQALVALRAALVGWDAAPTPPSSNSVFAMHDGMHAPLRHYLLGIVTERLGDTVAAMRYADSLLSAPLDTTRAVLARNLARGIRARVIRRRGDPAAALAELGQPWLDPSTHSSHRSSIFAHVAERYLRAELLYETGQLAEAVSAYGAVGDYSVDGLMYSGPSHLARARIYVQLGNRAKAREHLRRFIEMWRDCDPALRPMRDTAERQLATLDRRS
jgi:serine/threonine-protein kinase